MRGSRSGEGIFLVRLLVLLVGVKAVFLLLDSQIRLFLGDSQSYLWTAHTLWVPPDRSFLYGLLLRLLAFRGDGLQTVLAMQVLAGACSALLIAVILRRFFAIRRVVAGIAALLYCVEPLELLLERFVLTEAFAGLAFSGLILLCCSYLHRPRAALLFGVHGTALLLVALRSSFVPASYLIAIALPLLGPPKAAILRHGAVSLLFLLLLHSGYCSLIGWLAGREASYAPDAPLFLLSAWSPIVGAEDFPNPEIGRRVMGSVTYPLTRDTREAQRWLPGGLLAELEREVGSGKRLSEEARRIAVNAARRAPGSLFVLGVQSVLDFFRLPVLFNAMLLDRGGNRPPSEALRKLLVEQFHFTPLSNPNMETPATMLYAAAFPWYWFLLAVPLLFLALLSGSAWNKNLLLFLIAAAVVATVAMLASRPVVRYLHPLGILAFLALGQLAELRRGRLSFF